MTTEAVTAPQVLADTTEKPSSTAVTTPTPVSTAITPAKPTKPTTTPSKSTPKKSSQDESSRSPDLISGKRNELPKIIVKKEPSSPEPPSRHRPPKLHLSNTTAAAAGAVTPRTANGNLATMQDVGMACLSPGFNTHDPAMREQLQRSISVRDHQRSIIESRLQRHAKQGSDRNNTETNSKADRDEPATARERGAGAGERSLNTPRRRPPNSLTIVPPPHTAFAHERIVQSAPLNQSFTGRHQPHLSSNMLQHPPHQQVNRLPPITDVFANERLDSSRPRPVDTSTTNRQYFPSARPSYPSPNTLGFPRPREHRSAEEALASLSSGREDLIPRTIHYGGHPPTPPSPILQTAQTPSKLHVNNSAPDHPPHSGGGRRRNRAEYERDGSYGCEGGDSPDAKRRKKEEFLSLCARAWELFHS
ncbi:hypothetical protein RUND412_009775 [Rhizina undulata]